METRITPALEHLRREFWRESDDHVRNALDIAALIAWRIEAADELWVNGLECRYDVAADRLIVFKIMRDGHPTNAKILVEATTGAAFVSTNDENYSETLPTDPDGMIETIYPFVFKRRTTA